MSYTPNVPLSTQTFAQTQGPILNNFTSANNIFGIDHVNFTTSPAQGVSGQHLQVSLNNFQPDPSPALDFPVSRIYSKSFGASATYCEAYYSSPSSTPATFINLIPSIKAIGTFTSTGLAGAQPLTTTNTLTVNLTPATAVSASGAGTSVTFTVTFTTALTYATYYPVILGQTFAGSPIVPFNITTAGFLFIGPNISPAQRSTYRFFVF